MRVQPARGGANKLWKTDFGARSPANPALMTPEPCVRIKHELICNFMCTHVVNHDGLVGNDLAKIHCGALCNGRSVRRTQPRARQLNFQHVYVVMSARARQARVARGGGGAPSKSRVLREAAFRCSSRCVPRRPPRRRTRASGRARSSTRRTYSGSWRSSLSCTSLTWWTQCGSTRACTGLLPR